mgnify:CR=1 FL=1
MPETINLTPTWTGLLPQLLEAYTYLATKQDRTEDEADNLRILRDEFIKMSQGADMMNQSADFIESVYELAFGDDAISKEYTNEVLERLGEMTLPTAGEAKQCD